MWKSSDEITEAFRKIFEDSAIPKSAVHSWIIHFEKRWDAIDDQAGRGGPFTSMCEERLLSFPDWGRTTITADTKARTTEASNGSAYIILTDK